MADDNEYSIRTKLYFLVLVFVVGLVICDVSAYWVLRISRIKGENYQRISQGRELYNDISIPTGIIIEPYLLAFRQVNEKDKNELQLLIEKSKYFKSKYVQNHTQWESRLPNQALEQPLFMQSYLSALAFFDLWEKEFLPLVEKGDQDKARAVLLGSMNHNFDEHVASLDKLSEIVLAENVKIENEVEKFFQHSTKVLIITWSVVLILGALLAYFIGRSMTKQMAKVINALSSISSKINSKMDQQSHNVVEQSSSVHESSLTIKELNNSFKQTKTLAQESSNRAKKGVHLAEEGNDLLKKMIDGLLSHKEKVLEITTQISRLRDFVHQIHNLTLVTSNLTNQTNILALNAAVQAAHAKEQSAGLSVIAAEIRKLADESKKFLTNIDLISESIRLATESTMAMAEEGNRTLQENIQLAKNTLHSFNQLSTINNSSFQGAEQVVLNVEQQAAALQQILLTMGKLEEVAKQTVEATEHVRGEVKRLNAVSVDIQEAI